MTSVKSLAAGFHLITGRHVPTGVYPKYYCYREGISNQPSFRQ